MASAEASAAAPALDRSAPVDAQAMWDEAEVRRSHLRVRTLVTLRWLVIAGQTLLLAVMGLGLGYDAPYALCGAVVGAGAWINLLTGVASPGQRMTGAWEAAAQLAFDVAQITGLLYLTGGIANPFSLMLIAPVTLAAATLPLAPVGVLGAMAMAASSAKPALLPMRQP